MRKIFRMGAAVALGVMLSVPAAAAPVLLDSFTRNFGSNTGRIDPGGNDVLSGTFVTVSDQSTDRFSDSFNTSSLAGSTIDRFVLTLAFNSAGPSGLPSFGIGESWRVRIQGADKSAENDDLFLTLRDASSPQTFAVSTLTDTGAISAFAQSISSGSFEFWFAEGTAGRDAFNLSSAELKVFGTPSAIPLPASAFLLLGALGGLTALRRRKRLA